MTFLPDVGILVVKHIEKRIRVNYFVLRKFSCDEFIDCLSRLLKREDVPSRIVDGAVLEPQP